MTAAVPLSSAATLDAAVGRRSRMLALARRPNFLIGAVLLTIATVCALAPALVASQDPLASDPNGLTILGEPLPPLSPGHLLGTDALGRDEFARLVYGARVAMVIALIPNLLSLVVALLIGVTAGYARGWTELSLMRITESVMVLPAFLIAMAVIASFGASTAVIIATLVAIS